MRTGPSVVWAASSCWGFKSFERSIFRSTYLRLFLFYRNALRQITRLVDIATAPDGTVVSEQLQGNYFEDREQQFICCRHWNEVVRGFLQIRVALITNGNDNAVA